MELGETKSRAGFQSQLFRTAVDFECSMCGVRGPREMFDVHHISYDPEITVVLCVCCHAIITRNALSPEAQLQLNWANESLRLTLLTYQRRLLQLKTEITRLERLKACLEKGIFNVKVASSPEEAMRLLSKGYEPVGCKIREANVFQRHHRRISDYFR